MTIPLARRRYRLLRLIAAALLVVLVISLDHSVALAQDNGQDDAVRLADDAPPGMPTDPVGIMRKLGWMGWVFLVPFVGATLIALWFSVERLVVLKRNRVIPKPFVERFLEHLRQGKLDRDTALKLCEQSDSPVAAVFAHGVRKWGKSSVEVEQAIIDGGERQVSQLREHLRVLNGVATVTPLVGLLGTVIGMIQSFNDLATAGAMGNAEQLAVGIALALLTTASGLMIAIPSLIMYMFLSGRVDVLVMEMDHLAQSVVQLISAEALAEQPRRRKRTGESKQAV
ncbi:MAG: MotA/TolQ/ExbB proton channel family protein [Planctomycetaceae bacterium]|jgi:biopolymer transport protein ExbB|nr:MotA/TolQ/ExbB proton channel family protein [Planctomycetaceae bacterium]